MSTVAEGSAHLREYAHIDQINTLIAVLMAVRVTFL